MRIIESHLKASRCLAVLIHGQAASKDDWVTRGGYTKGGDLTKLLEERGHSWMAGDLYGHGDWTASEADFDVDDISDEMWPSFLARSSDELRKAVAIRLERHSYECLDIVTYSLGCLVAVKMISDGLPLVPRRIVMAVPATEREHDDEYSLHNNLGVFSSSSVSIALGEADEGSLPADVRWFFDQIPGDNKILRSYEAGHSLPLEWVNDVIKDITG